MTYRQLRNRIQVLPEDHMDDDVTVQILREGESFVVCDFVNLAWGAYSRIEAIRIGVPNVQGVLDDDHPYLTIEG